MNLLPQTYLLGLVGLLAVVAVVVGRQLLNVRRDEIKLIELEQGGALPLVRPLIFTNSLPSSCANASTPKQQRRSNKR